MQISLKLIRLINHAKITVCIKFQLLEIFSSLFTDSSITPALLRTGTKPKKIIVIFVVIVIAGLETGKLKLDNSHPDAAPLVR